MKRFILSAIATIALFGTQANAQATWNVDASHSNVKFAVRHLVVSTMEGTFKVYSGSVKASKEDFSDAQIDFAIDVNSINTDNTDRDNHLKSDDFFNAEKFPQMTFKSTSFKKKGKKYILEGNLTIRDVTKPMKFSVEYGGTVKDPWGNTKAGFKVFGIINRYDYNLKWSAATEAGQAVVDQNVMIMLNLEFAKAK